MIKIVSGIQKTNNAEQNAPTRSYCHNQKIYVSEEAIVIGFLIRHHHQVQQQQQQQIYFPPLQPLQEHVDFHVRHFQLLNPVQQ